MTKTSFKDYIQISKPGINLNNLFSVFTGYVLASRFIDFCFWNLLYVLLGSGLIIAGSSIINNVYDRKIDKLMERTRSRALPDGRISTPIALVYGIFLAGLGFLVLHIFTNRLVVILGTIGFVVYAFIYTMWLKRSSIYNTVVGGISGAVPPMMGWAAVTGSIDLSAWGLFLLLFLWQPPHFFALAILRRQEYQDAGIPMMPVIKGLKRTIWEIIIFTLLLVPSSFIFVYSGVSGIFYSLCATALGLIYIYLAFNGLGTIKTDQWAKKMFFYSLYYLMGILIALIVDVAITDIFRKY